MSLETGQIILRLFLTPLMTLLVEWLVKFVVVLSILKILTNGETALPMDPISPALPLPAHSVSSHQCTPLFPILWYEVLKRVEGCSLTVLGHLKSLPSYPCSHTLTTSPAHLWPPHHPSHFITSLARVSRMIHGAIKLRGGDLKGQLIQPPS